jgi:hypothetical protein
MPSLPESVGVLHACMVPRLFLGSYGCACVPAKAHVLLNLVCESYGPTHNYVTIKKTNYVTAHGIDMIALGETASRAPEY